MENDYHRSDFRNREFNIEAGSDDIFDPIVNSDARLLYIGRERTAFANHRQALRSFSPRVTDKRILGGFLGSVDSQHSEYASQLDYGGQGHQVTLLQGGKRDNF